MKTATITTRVSPELKEKSEEIINMLGINLSDAISMFLTQVVYSNGLPFTPKIDPIYSPEHVAYLQEVMARMDAGDKIYHDILEDDEE